MYINLNFHRRAAGPRYRTQQKKTRALRRRADYPHTENDLPPKAAKGRRFSGQLRFTMGCCALAAIFLAGISAWKQDHRPVGCREGDLMPISKAALAESAEEDAPKTVYLTFDDGPSANTETVLETLRAAGVPASFFIVGAEGNEKYFSLLPQMLEDGHCIGLHSATHEYSKIYASAEAYWTDIEALRQKLQTVCGEYTCSVLRFPGGSSNTVSHKYGGDGLMPQLIEQAEEKGYTVVDWNVTAEDSVGGNPSADTIAGRVIKGCKEKNRAIILMHDSATNAATAEALPTIIRWLQENEYTFDTVDHLPA